MSIDLSRTFLVVDSLVVDDDSLGPSHGDGDGVLEFRETIELWVELWNLGHQTGEGVWAELGCTSPYIQVLQSDVDYGQMLPGEHRFGEEPFVFSIDPLIPDGEEVQMTLELSHDPSSAPLFFTFSAPAHLIGFSLLDDSAGGDGDGFPEAGEEVSITLHVTNVSHCAVPQGQASLAAESEWLFVDGEPCEFGPLDPGYSCELPGFTVELSPDAPSPGCGYLLVSLDDGAGYATQVRTNFPVGLAYASDFERSSAAWWHRCASEDFGDEWHAEAYRNHTPGGSTSAKCGGAGSASYGNLLHAALETAPLWLPAGSQVRFYHWIQAETSGLYPEYCYDGGMIEISTDGGETWTQLTPEGGYPYKIRPGAIEGPWPAETEVWSGEHDWEEVVVDVSSYSGCVRLRWAFGSDGAVVKEGWYLDDIVVERSGAAATWDPGAPRVPLLAAAPNPLLAGSRALRIALSRPPEEPVRVVVVDLAGRLVADLGRLEGGSSTLTSDTMDTRGSLVPGGVYYLRCSGSAIRESLPLVLVR